LDISVGGIGYLRLGLWVTKQVCQEEANITRFDKKANKKKGASCQRFNKPLASAFSFIDKLSA